MSSPAPPEIEAASATSGDSLQRLQACLRHIAHLLPAQAPLRDFVHHNTLHALQHLPFVEALREAERMTGARPWLDEARCRELFRLGRVDASDLVAALRQLPATGSDQPLLPGSTLRLRRGDVLQASLRYPPATISAARLRWQLEEKLAGERLQADLDPLARQALLTAAAADGLDERAAVADLWATACALRGSAEAMAQPPAEPSATSAGALWQELVDRLGDQWTLATLLAHLTGEDLR